MPAFDFVDVSSFPSTLKTNSADTSSWSVDRAVELYKIEGWGAPYFSVNGKGNITANPHGRDTLPYKDIDLMKVVKKVSDPKIQGGLGLQLPLIVRFPEILKHRLQSLQSAFDHAIRSSGYTQHYQGVYPIKCNQDRFIVQDIVEFGSQYHFGLEAGSKPELLLAMSCLAKRISSDAFLVCNGYKDEEYISLALLARNMNLNTVIVLEQEKELDTVISASRKLGIRPVIGLRAKLRTKHSGHFGSTSGEKGKFGLNKLQILAVLKKLKSFKMLDCLQLLHFHIGSQIPSIDLLSAGVVEAAQIYCELFIFGAGLKVIDIGGGLGIDYDGSHSGDSDMSVSYDLHDYAASVVQAISNACDMKNVPHPVIVSESGRALVSHHSVLVFEAISSSSMDTKPTNFSLAYLSNELSGDNLLDYRNVMNSAMRGDHNTCKLYIERLKTRCDDQFNDGSLDFNHITAVDSFCEIMMNTMEESDPVRVYDVNLSVFTSIPDFWGIGQLFPIVPIHRLDEMPTENGTLSDLTCDSDGKIDHFIGGTSSLPLHELDNGGSGYYLGMFLGGAYQEALGGIHNLFGGPSVVRVAQNDETHNFSVTRAVPGLSCANILKVMQYEPEVMFGYLKQCVDDLGLIDGDEMCCQLAAAFHSMPYLVSSSNSQNDKEEAQRKHFNEEIEGTMSDAVIVAASDELDCDIYRCMLEG